LACELEAQINIEFMPYVYYTKKKNQHNTLLLFSFIVAFGKRGYWRELHMNYVHVRYTYKEYCTDLKAMYSAASSVGAKGALENFCEKWKAYPSAVKTDWRELRVNYVHTRYTYGQIISDM
jgi:hypothetical protein